MVKSKEKLHHAKAFKRAKKMLDNSKNISDVLQETNLNHRDVLKIKNEDR